MSRQKIIFYALAFGALLALVAVDALGKDFVQLGTLGSNVNRKFAQQSIDLLNKIHANGCLKNEIEKYKFATMNNYKGWKAKDSKEVYEVYVKNAPYKMNLRWYSKRFSRVIGYTYNESDIIWSNTRMMGGAMDYGSHLAHELSHQARAGGFVHWTVFKGSVPYAIGDIAYDCIKRLPR